MSSKIDLHVHSKYSDGTNTPLELVKIATDIGLQAFALTDHDTIDGIKECIQIGNKYNIEVIPGIEFSCDCGFEVHMLGLFIDTNSKVLNDNLKSLVAQRDNRNQKMVKRLNELGFDIKLEEVYDIAGGNVIGRPHFARVMISKGYVNTITEAFDKYIGEGKPGYVGRDKKITPKEAIDIIKQSNGISVLAHPGLIEMDKSKIKDFIVMLKDYGLDGVEVYHSDHTDDITQYLLELATNNDLLISGGSDFHGSCKDIICMGNGRDNLNLSYNLLQNMKDYLYK